LAACGHPRDIVKLSLYKNYMTHAELAQVSVKAGTQPPAPAPPRPAAPPGYEPPPPPAEFGAPPPAPPPPAPAAPGEVVPTTNPNAMQVRVSPEAPKSYTLHPTPYTLNPKP
jgi:hypothetical protein